MVLVERSCKKCSFSKTQLYKTTGSAVEKLRGTSKTKETSNCPARIGSVEGNSLFSCTDTIVRFWQVCMPRDCSFCLRETLRAVLLAS